MLPVIPVKLPYPSEGQMSFHFSFDLKSQEKKKPLEKKKTAFSFIQSILLQKVKKMIFSGEKKNGTFALGKSVRVCEFEQNLAKN